VGRALPKEGSIKSGGEKKEEKGLSKGAGKALKRGHLKGRERSRYVDPTLQKAYRGTSDVQGGGEPSQHRQSKAGRVGNGSRGRNDEYQTCNFGEEVNRGARSERGMDFNGSRNLVKLGERWRLE